MQHVKSPDEGNLFNSQKELEETFSKHQIMPFLRNICKERGYEKTLKDYGIHVPFGIDLLCQMMLHKRANIITLVGILRHHFKDTAAMSAVQQCTEELIKAVDVDAVNYDGDTHVFVVSHDIQSDEQRALNQFQYPLPMVTEPEQVCDNAQTGYQTIPGSLLLKDNHHDEDICLDHINRVNSIPLRLNPDIVAFVQNHWKHVDKIKEDESFQDFKKRQRAFQKYDGSSREILKDLMAINDSFWLTHRYDKRGRTYCQGYHCTYQGNNWNKACIELADAEPLNKE